MGRDSACGDQVWWRWRCRLVLGLWCVAIVLLAPGVRAQDVARVVLVTSDRGGATATRIQAELDQLGVEVVVTSAESAPVGRAPLEQTARSVGAFAAIRIVPLGGAVEVWIADRVTGKTVVREVISRSEGAASTEDTVAVGAVELLRASLLELNLSERPRRSELPAPPAARELATPKEPALVSGTPRRGRHYALTAAAGFGPELGWGGVGTSWLGQAALGGYSRGWLGGELYLSIALRPVQVEGEGGTAELSISPLGLTMNLSPPSGTVVPLVGIGPGLVLVRSEGVSAEPGYQTSESSQARGALFMRAGLGWQMMDHLRLRFDTAFVLARPVRIRFGGRDVAEWGTPRLMAAAALELLVPGDT